MHYNLGTFLALIVWIATIPISLQFTFNVLTSSNPTTSKRRSCLFGNQGENNISLISNNDDGAENLKRLPYEFHIAPMQCYTNLPLRKLFSLLSPSSILWTEMEKVDDILHPDGTTNATNKNQSLIHSWMKRLGMPSDDHSNLILQLGCNNPNELKSCISRTLQDYTNLRGINLNCGCPSIMSGGASCYGASLMKNVDLTGDLVRAMKEAVDNANLQVPPEISVKCRIGVIDNFEEIRSLTLDCDYEYLYNYVSTIKEAGADHVILHARPAILSGLSPVRNRVVPELNYDIVEKIASDFPTMRITMNGGITGLDHFKAIKDRSTSKQDISSHMAGRWCLRRPLDLIEVDSILDFKDQGKEISAVQVIEDYLDFALTMIDNQPKNNLGITGAEWCLPLYLVSEQLREDYDAIVNEYEGDDCTDKDSMDVEEIESIFNTLYCGAEEVKSALKGGHKAAPIVEDISFKKLSKSFKSVGGKKVVNKWKRNREEL
jgi:tRNA-dihydrouridine synthase A